MMGNVLRCKKLLKGLIPQRLRVGLQAWIRHRIAAKLGVRRGTRGDQPWGVNLYGDLSAAAGLAEAARSTQLGLIQAGVPTCAKDFAQQVGEDLFAPYGINLIHTNPNLMLKLFFKIPKEQWLGRYNIGFWLWEQEEIPEDWLSVLPLFDEIWTSSEFCASAIRKSQISPVTVIRHIVEPVCDETFDRTVLGIPEDMFLFLAMFDCNSVAERKNPWGAIQAFQGAFGGRGEKVGLVIKTRNLDGRTRRELRERLKGCPYVWILEGDYSKPQVNSLIRMADVYVSLHRAEGFGLVLAEAMYLGTPVIATNWSANTEFMDRETACMVEVKLVRLEKDILPYRKGSRWADPDLKQATEYMRRLYEDEEYRTGLIQRAKARVRDQLSTDRVAEQISERLTAIKRELE